MGIDANLYHACDSGNERLAFVADLALEGA